MTDSSYETVADFGVLYDAVPLYAGRPDVPFYLEEAARAAAAGPRAKVLELGCGTGRILLPLARAGHTVTGLDLSPAMLARCRDKLAAEPPAVRQRVTLHQADMRDFTLPPPAPGGFSVALAPFRVLQHLASAEEQIGCFQAVRRHLAPGRRFVFDVFNPNYRLMTQDRSQEAEDTAELELPDGRYLRRAVRVIRVSWVKQLSEGELIYYLRTGSSTRRIVQAISMRWYTPFELQHLLERAGFRLEARYGNFDRSPLGDESPDIVVVALRAGAD